MESSARRILFLFMTFLLYVGSVAHAQSSRGTKEPRILILLDESSSMIEKWGSEKRFEVADRIILDLMDSVYQVNDQVEFSLRVFGHQYTVPENNCYDTKNEVMFSKNNYTQMSLRLASITPLGVTPIAYALKEAAENDLIDEWRYAYSVVLITDGGESCGGNLCDVVKTLLQKKIDFKPYIISLVDYAPLKTQYDCLGNYLQVTSNGDIPKTVRTIVDSYRPMLKPVKKDSAIAVQPPPVVREPVVDAPKTKLPVTEAPAPVTAKTEPAPPVIAKAVPPAAVLSRPQQNFNRVTLIDKLTELSYVTRYIPLRNIGVPKPVILKMEDEVPVAVTPPPPPPLPKVKLTRLARKRQLKELSYFSDEPIPATLKNIPQPIFVAVQIPAEPTPVNKPTPTPAPKPVASKPPVKKPTPPAPPKPKKEEGKEVPFSIQTEDAKETMVEVFFTDGRGKFYYTSPEVRVNDPASGETVQKFYRTLDANNTPDPQKMKEGNYNIVIGGKSNMIMRNITVQPNKLNKIMVVVSSGTLKFEYKGAPDRPITEFSAVVILRTDRGGPVIRQKCNQELPYDPGNYAIEINTLPISRRNEDIDPGAESILVIDEPGYVQFTNTTHIGKVGLYTPLGDRFAQFYTIDVNGNVASQKLRLQPGTYQAHFFKDPNRPFAQETISTFQVKSNDITEVELK